MSDVIYVGAFKLPNLNAAALRVINNAKALRELGYNVILVGTDKVITKDIETTKKIINGFDTYSVNNNKWNKFKYILSINYIKRIHRMYPGTKMIIAYNYPSVALEKLRKYCLQSGIKLIADCTEWGMNSLNIARNLDVKLRMEIIQPKCDRVIAISEYMYKYYHNKKVSTVLLPPLTDLKFSNSPTLAKSEKIVFTYAGNPGSKKDRLGLFLQAFSEIKVDRDYIVNIIGINKEDFLKKNPSCQEYIRKLSKHVNFVGRIKHDEVIRFLRQSSFVFFIREPNRSNMAGFPTKFAEAVSCAIPVITNLTSDISKYLVDKENGFVIKDCNVDSIKTTLYSVFNTSDEKIKQMQNCCEKNKDAFDYHMYIDVIKNIL